MKIGFKSDIHLDYWIEDENEIASFVKEVLKPQFSDVLILAGDIGHFNRQNLILFDELSKYSKVFVTYGNHDMYLFDDKERERYRFSKNRIKELKECIEKRENVYFFDGDIFDFEGVSFLGFPGWYDFSYALKYGISYEKTEKMWEVYLNDARKIHPKPICENLSLLYKEKVKDKIKKSDIVFSHVPPVYIKCKNDVIIDSFYSFYGYDLLDFPLKYWIFGHCHKPMDFFEEMVRFVSSPLGTQGRVGKKEIDYIKLKGV